MEFLEFLDIDKAITCLARWMDKVSPEKIQILYSLSQEKFRCEEIVKKRFYSVVIDYLRDLDALEGILEEDFKDDPKELDSLYNYGYLPQKMLLAGEGIVCYNLKNYLFVVKKGMNTEEIIDKIKNGKKIYPAVYINLR